ncbi:MAG: aldo/keto reductase, partial [Pseudomonadota bacterium]
MERVSILGDLSFSRIVYGMWRLADDVDRSEANVRAKIDACLEQGITTFDQADIYGDYESEEVFGAALKADPSLRDKMEIATKCGIMLTTDKVPSRRVKHYDTSRAHITTSVENSLTRMGIERIDLLMIHRPDPFMDPEETGAALDGLVSSGKVASIGVSNFKPYDIRLLDGAMASPLVANQIEISVLHTEPFVDGDLAEIMERSMAPMAWSPLAGGALFESENAALLFALQKIGDRFAVDATAVALAWLLAHPAKILPVVGTNTMPRIRALSDALKVEMDRQTW